jgi:hypothetical protein
MKTLSESRKKRIKKGAGIGLLLVKGFFRKKRWRYLGAVPKEKAPLFYFTLLTEKPLTKVSGSDPIMFDEVVKI